MNDDIVLEKTLYRLSMSKFRSGFHLNKKMKEYVSNKGLEKIEMDAYDFINKRLKDKNPKNDGRQTPMKQVHPVFIAQHACSCCCRGCLEKWHKIEKGRELTEEEVKYIVALLMKWIKKEVK